MNGRQHAAEQRPQGQKEGLWTPENTTLYANGSF